jgi:hypothetical protein
MNTLFAHTKPLLTFGVGFCAAVGALSLTHLGPVQAQSPGVNLAALVAKVNALTAQNTALQGRVTALETKTAPLSVSGSLLKIEGVNVQIDDGTGATSSASGLGNLTIGYNELVGVGDTRTGSHNLILGMWNSYSSYGGIVAGIQNRISAPFASVTGGYAGTAGGYAASVSGGNGNVAAYYFTSVSGGKQNMAGGYAASVSGGNANKATGFYASVSGGATRTQSVTYGWSAGSESGTAVGGNFTSP